jgi:hypothetical protein
LHDLHARFRSLHERAGRELVWCCWITSSADDRLRGVGWSAGAEHATEHWVGSSAVHVDWHRLLWWAYRDAEWAGVLGVADYCDLTMILRFQSCVKLHAQPVGSVAAAPSITAPTAYWNLGESSTRLDQVTSPASCDLAKSGSIGSVAGLIGNASQGASVSVLHNTSAPSKMDPGANPWSMWGWVKPNGTEDLLGLGQVNNGGFIASYDGVKSALTVVMYQDFEDSVTLSTGNGSMTNLAWNFIAIWWDGTKLWASVNNGTPVSAVSSQMGAVSQMAILGTSSTFSPSTIMDEFAFWNNHAVTSAELTAGYNSGSGRTYTVAGGWV